MEVSKFTKDITLELKADNTCVLNNKTVQNSKIAR